METSPIARALETLAGPWLAPLASALRTLAIVALIAALIVSAIQIAAGVLAWKYGWERGTVVRCRRCGRLAVDRETSVCPEGHPVHFPSGAGSHVRRFDARWTIAWRTYGLLVPIATGALALWGYAALRPGPLRLSVSSLLASTAYLFFLAALSSAAWALSPQPRGALGRALHLILAALCLTPVLPLALMAQWIEPPAREPLGSLWTTPTATYLSAGRGRARRVARLSGKGSKGFGWQEPPSPGTEEGDGSPGAWKAGPGLSRRTVSGSAASTCRCRCRPMSESGSCATAGSCDSSAKRRCPYRSFRLPACPLQRLSIIRRREKDPRRVQRAVAFGC